MGRCLDPNALIVVLTLATCERKCRYKIVVRVTSDAVRSVREIVADFQTAIYREEACYANA